MEYNKENLSNDNKIIFDQYMINIQNELTDVEKKILQFKNQLLTEQNNHQYISIAIVTYYLKYIGILLKSDQYFYSLFNKHNQILLDKARKEFSEINYTLKKHFEITLYPDFAKTSPKSLVLDQLTPHRMYNLITQFIQYSNTLIESYGINSKYIVTLAHIYSDLYAFVLNSIDFQKYFVIVKDLTHTDNLTTRKILELFQDMSQTSSKLFIYAYQITKDKTLLHQAINTLNTIITYFRLSGEHKEIPELERKVKSWERELNIN